MRKYLGLFFALLLCVSMSLAQNDSSDNETTIIYGPNVENNTRVSIGFEVFLLVLFIVISLIAIISRIGGLLLGAAGYSVIYGIYLISSAGFWIGIIIMAIGAIYAVAGYYKLQ